MSEAAVNIHEAATGQHIIDRNGSDLDTRCGNA
jgi:hypothetical protein